MTTLYILDQYERAIGAMDNRTKEGLHFFDDLLTTKLEYGYMDFQFSVRLDHPQAVNLQKEYHVLVPDEDGKQLLFRIKTLKRNTKDNRLSVWCESSASTDLLSSIVRPIKLNSTTAQNALNVALVNTDWSIGQVDFSGAKDIDFSDYTNAFAAMQEIAETFGGEIEYEVVFDGLKVSKKYVHLLTKRGTDTKKLFRYGQDIAGVEITEDTRQLFTAIVPIGKGKEDGTTLTLDGYTPSSIESGYEKQEDWIGNKDAFQKYHLNGRHRFYYWSDDKAQSPAELFANGLAELKKISKPNDTYNMDVVLLERLSRLEAHKVRLGDTIRIDNRSSGVLAEARVNTWVRSLTDRSKSNVTLSEFINILPSLQKRVSRLRDVLNKRERSWIAARNGLGSGAHVIAHAPQPLTDGSYANSNHYLSITVTENTHMASVSVYCQNAGQSGTIELRDSNNTALLTKDLTGLTAGENVIALGWFLSKDAGSYRLYGDFSGNTWRTEITSFPYTSGAFSVTGTSDSSGYWNHFYNIRIGGAFASGGIGARVRVGDGSDRLGTFEALDANGETIMKVDSQQVSISKLTVGEIDSPSIPAIQSADLTCYVDPINGSDENDGLTSGTAFRSFSRCISAIPRVLDGTVSITLLNDIKEDFTPLGIGGYGKISLNLNSKVLTGSVITKACSTLIEVKDGTINASATETRAPTQAYSTFYLYMSNVTVRGRAGTGGTSFVINSQDGSFVHLVNSYVYNAVTALCFATYNGKIQIENVKGNGGTGGTGTNLRAEYCGVIGVKGTTASQYYPVGTTFVRNGGQVIIDSGAQQDTDGTNNTTPTAPSVITSNSTSGNTYRPLYSAWRNDGTVRQGTYGNYGNNMGYWFFPSSLSSTIIGKTISKIEVSLKRLTGSGDGTGTFTVWAHGYTSQPSSGTPTRITTTSYNVTFKQGESRTFTLPSSFHSLFSNGTAKGVALYTTSTVSSAYGSFDDSGTIKITYS